MNARQFGVTAPIRSSYGSIEIWKIHSHDFFLTRTVYGLNFTENQ